MPLGSVAMVHPCETARVTNFEGRSALSTRPFAGGPFSRLDRQIQPRQGAPKANGGVLADTSAELRGFSSSLPAAPRWRILEWRA